MELWILGPIEARIADEPLSLSRGKQLTVLGLLLLRAGEIVSIEDLVDELWGESPPSSAGHTLEVYVSRLRQLFNGHGPSLVRRGTGYVLELGDAVLDARDFTELAGDVSRAAADGQHEVVTVRASEALSLWRGKALADVELGAIGRAETDRLVELRLRTLELRIDSELALGRHERAVGELQSLVAQNPYRERFVAQLMIALYRSGRHAEALAAYEQTRRRLDDDLGLQPSADLQQLSAQIVRQEPALRAPAVVPAAPRELSARHQTGERARRLAGLVAAGTAVAAVMALTAAGGARQLELASDSPTTRVALVVQSIPAAERYDEWRRNELVNALDGLRQLADTDSQLVEVDAVLAPSDAERVTDRLATGGFDLVLFALNADGARAFAPQVRRLPRARSVFIDSSLAELGLAGESRATGIRFATEAAAQLAGALGGLMRPRAPATRHADVVSVVAGEKTLEATRAVAAFRRGVARALPRAKVLVRYTNEMLDPTACERAANAQIDAGSDLVFAHSGRCGTGALAVARTRGVWAISGDGVSEPAGNVLGAIFKDWDNAVYTAAAAFVDGRLPAGDVVLGLDGYNVGLDMSPTLPAGIGSRVVRLCSDIRLHSAQTSMTTRAEP